MKSGRTLLQLQHAEDLLQEERWGKALALLKRLALPANPSLRAQLLFSRAEAGRLGGLHAEALGAYEKSAALYKKTKDPAGRHSSLLGAAACLRHIEDFSKAGRYCREALASAPDRRLRADALCAWGLSLKGEGKLEEARRKLEESLGIYARLKDKEGLAHNLWAMGVIQRTAGRLTEALKTLSETAQIYASLEDAGGLAYTRCALGGALRVSGEAAESFELYQKAQGAFRKLSDPYGIAYGFCGTASAERVRGKSSEALARYRQAEILYSRLRQKTPLAFTWWGQAGARRIKGEMAAALRLHKKSKVLFRSTGDKRGELYPDLGLAQCDFEAGRREAAKKSFKEILARAETLGLPLEACHAQRGLLLCSPSGFLTQALAERYRSLGASPDALLHEYKDIP